MQNAAGNSGLSVKKPFSFDFFDVSINGYVFAVEDEEILDEFDDEEEESDEEDEEDQEEGEEEDERNDD